MNVNSFLRTHFWVATLVTLLSFFVQEVFAQREAIPLADAEITINKKCSSSAEIVLTETYTTGKVVHIFLLMDEKDFTKSNLIKFFSCVSRQYPKLAVLDITARSDRKELDFQVENFLHPPPSNMVSPQVIDSTKPLNHYRAYYSRWDVIGLGEYVEYSPDPKSWRMVKYKFKKRSVPLQ